MSSGISPRFRRRRWPAFRVHDREALEFERQWKWTSVNLVFTALQLLRTKMTPNLKVERFEHRLNSADTREFLRHLRARTIPTLTATELKVCSVLLRF